MKIKKILIPFDFSECAENALNYALNIKEKTQAELCLLNICMLPSPYAETDYYYEASVVEETEQANRERLHQLKKDTPALFGSQIETSSHISVTEGIKHRLQEQDIDLIIMGTKGAKGLYEILFGSHASSLVKETKVPTLVVPESYKTHGFARMAFAGDYENVEDPQEAYILADLCQAFNAELEIFYVNPLNEPITQEKAFQAAQLEDYFKDTKHSYHEIKHQSPEQGITEYIDQHKIDLISMIPRRHTVLETLFKGSLTKKMVSHLQIPILVLHDE